MFFSRRLLASTLFVTCLGVSLMSCGDSGNSISGFNGTAGSQNSTQNPVQRLGKIVVPDGFAIRLGDLQASSASGDAAGSASGEFTNEDNPFAFLLALDPNGKAVLLGMVIDGQSVELSSRSTATTLLYLALGGYSLKEDSLRRRLWLDLYDDPALPPLTAAIEAALLRNPTALADGDQSILDQLEATRNQIIQRISPRIQAKTVTITPSSAQSGTTLTKEPDDNLTVTCDIRRYGAILHVYKSGTVKDNQTTLLSTAEEKTPLIGFQYGGAAGLASIGDILGAGLNALFNINAGGVQAFYASTQTLEKGLFPADASADKTLYKVIQISPAFSPNGPKPDPGFFSDSHYAPYVAEWRREFATLNNLEFLSDIFLPLISQLCGGIKFSKTEETIAFAFVNNLFNLTPTFQQRSQAIIAGNASQVPLLLTDFFTAIGKGEVLTQLAELAGKSTLNGRFLTAFANAVGPIRAINLGLLATDSLRLLHDLILSNKGDAWDVTVEDTPSPTPSPTETSGPDQAFHHTFRGTFTYTSPVVTVGTPLGPENDSTNADLVVDWEPPSSHQHNTVLNLSANPFIRYNFAYSSQNRAHAETGGAAWVDPNNINPLPVTVTLATVSNENLNGTPYTLVQTIQTTVTETTATASVDFLVNGVNCLHGDFTGTAIP